MVKTERTTGYDASAEEVVFIGIAFDFPDASDPVIPILFILILILKVLLILHQFQDLFYSINKKIFVLDK